MRAQEVLADDLYITQFAWGPSILQAYNSGAWADVQQATGFGIADFNIYLTYLNARPKTNRKRSHRRHHGRRSVDQHHQRRQSLPRHRPHDL